MEKITLILIGLIFTGSFQATNTIDSDELCLAKADVEKILGSPARQTESETITENNVLQHKCSWKATQEDLNSNLYYLDEQHQSAASADKVFDDIVVSNRNNSGQSHPDIGDEAWFHSDGTNFCLIMVRKENKIMRMKVNKLTKDTSVDEMKRIAEEWKWRNVDNNPLEYISAFRKVNSVVVRGRYYSRIKLDKMLGDAKKRKEEVDKER